jgi:hypothetical protein
MKIHNHLEQFDGKMHSVCGYGSAIVMGKEFEATDPKIRCKLCERDWFPNGQPEWHRQQAIKALTSD